MVFRRQSASPCSIVIACCTSKLRSYVQYTIVIIITPINKTKLFYITGYRSLKISSSSGYCRWMTHTCEISLLPRCSWGLCCSWTLQGLGWQLVAGASEKTYSHFQRITRCPEISATSYQQTPRNIPEDRKASAADLLNTIPLITST